MYGKVNLIAPFFGIGYVVLIIEVKRAFNPFVGGLELRVTTALDSIGKNGIIVKGVTVSVWVAPT